MKDKQRRPFNVTVSNDKMTCFLQIFYTGERIDISTILNVLRYNNIIIGVDRNSIVNAIQNSYDQKKDMDPVVIARGDSPPLDQSEKVEFYTRFPEQELKECSENYFKTPRVRSVESVKKGSIVAERHVLDDNIIRTNIFGNIVKTITLSPGKHTALNNENQYIADCDGYAVIENASISVVPFRWLTVKIKKSDDRFKAEVILEKNEFEELIPSAEDIIKIMKNAGVKYGIDKKLIEDELSKISIADSKFPITFTAAKGDSKTDGEDAHFNLFFPINPDIVNIPLSLLTYPEKGTIDKIFRHNEKIAEKIKSKPSKPGYLVTGEVIKAKTPRDIELYFDFPVTTNEDTKANKIEYLTGIRGSLKLKDNKVMIQPRGDEYIDINISEDKLSAVLDFYLPVGGGKPLTFNTCLKTLKSHSIIYGIDDKKIRVVLSRLEKDKKPLKGIEAVRGEKPMNGKDGELKCYFTPQSTKPKVDAFGNVDHYDLGPIPFIKKDKVVVEIISPTKGGSGKNIYGEEILPIPGNDVSIQTGQNVSISEDGKKIIALVNGCPKIESGILMVVEVYETVGDVSFTTGNIRYKGDVIVNGNIKSGFKVESLEGEVQIRGVVYGALIKAKKDIKVANGIVGERKCRVYTEGNLVAKFIERSVIDVQGNLEVGNYIMDSMVTVGGSIRAVTGRGLILGGQALAASDIEAVTVGNVKGVKTYLYAGQRYDLIKKSSRLSKEKQKLDEDLIKLNKSLDRLDSIEDSKKTEAEKNPLSKMKEQQQKYIKRINFLQNTLTDINAKIKQEKEKLEGRVLIREKCFPGVFIYINEREFTAQSEIQAKIFTFDRTKESIVIKPF